MEAFESLVKVALEAEDYVVTSNVKFPVTRETRKRSHTEVQTHGYEVDLVGARGDSLVLASVKSFLGSKGVSRQGFLGLADPKRPQRFGGYKLFNEPDIRQGVVHAAEKRFGYTRDQVELRLYVGRFVAKDEQDIRRHLAKIHVGGKPVRVVGLTEIMERLVDVAKSKTYVDDPVVVTLKALRSEGLDRLTGP